MLTESTRQNKKKNRDAHIWTQNRIRTGRADAGRAFVANCPVPADQVPTASLSCPLTVALAGLLELDSARFPDEEDVAACAWRTLVKIRAHTQETPLLREANSLNIPHCKYFPDSFPDKKTAPGTNSTFLLLQNSPVCMSGRKK